VANISTAPKRAENPHVLELRKVGGRTVRVAQWKADPKRGKPGRPILFFNGIGANIELMSPLAEWFPDRDIVTFDMPGVGFSPSPVTPYRPWMIARMSARLLDEFGYDKVDVMGVSWGGGMAQQFAFQHPRRVHRVVLAATSAGTVMVPGDVRALTKMADPQRYLDPHFMRRNFETLYGDELGGAGNHHMARITPPSRSGYLYQLAAMLGWTSVFFLPFLRQHSLILMGDQDRIVPLINGRILHALIPKAHLEVIKGGGHLFLVTRPAETVPVIRDFLDEKAKYAAPGA
jgi:poly(3-hydroxyalkanoate) depolymerase